MRRSHFSRYDPGGLACPCHPSILRRNVLWESSVADAPASVFQSDLPVAAKPRRVDPAAAEARDVLNGHAERLHRIHSAAGLTPYQVFGQLARLKQDGRSPVAFELPAAPTWTLEDSVEAIVALIAVGREFERCSGDLEGRATPQSLDTPVDAAIDALANRAQAACDPPQPELGQGGRHAALPPVGGVAAVRCKSPAGRSRRRWLGCGVQLVTRFPATARVVRSKAFQITA